MDDRKRAARAKLDEQLPAELIEPMIRLHRRRERINLKLLPSESFVLCGAIQAFVRAAALPDEQSSQLRNIVDQLIAEVANIEPVLEYYLLLGWNPDHDHPLERRGT